MFFGHTPDPVCQHVVDLNRREWAAILPLLALMLWMGVGPHMFLPPISATNTTILDRSKAGAIYHVELKHPLPMRWGKASHER